MLQVIGEAIDDYQKTERGEWVKKWPGQAVLCVSQLYWTTLVTESINNGSQALDDYLQVILDIVSIWSWSRLSSV